MYGELEFTDVFSASTIYVAICQDIGFEQHKEVGDTPEFQNYLQNEGNDRLSNRNLSYS